jgi:hypothetical protein
MPALGARAWILRGRLKRRLARRRPAPGREDLIRRHAAGRSFADVGCMWRIDGALCFLAEEAGATSVTGIDVMPASERFEAERAQRGSSVRFIQGDLHDPSTVEAAGAHDVVWSSGLLYHAPHPLLTLERLRSLTGELLVLSTETIPELAGVEGGCVFFPGLSAPQRAAHARRGEGTRLGIDSPFDPAEGYGNWFWGISPSALRGMLAATGFDVVEEYGDPFHVTVLAEPR